MKKLILDEQTYKILANKLYDELARYEREMTHRRRLEIDKNLLQTLLPYLFADCSIDRYIPYIDFSGVSFDDVDVRFKDFRESNVNLNPQIVKNRDLSYVNLKDIDMSSKDFTDTVINNTILINTGAIININKLRKKLVVGSNFNGCYIIGSRDDLIERGCSPSNFESAVFLPNVDEEEARRMIKDSKEFAKSIDNLIEPDRQKVKTIGVK